MKYFFLIVLTGFTLCSQAQIQSECCNNSDCNNQATAIANRVNSAFILLGFCPENDGKKDSVIAVLSPNQHQYIEEAISEYQQCEPDLSTCVQSKVATIDISNWLIYYLSRSTDQPGLPSPNFQKGWDLLLGLNFFGGTGVFTDKERFSSMYSLQIGRTIGRDDPAKSRNFRWLIGGSIYYQKSNTEYLISPRLEWRMTDLEFTPFNAGALKLHLQGHFNDSDYLIDTGLAFETFILGINVATIGYDHFAKTYYLNTGIFVNLARIKFNSK